MTMMLHGFTVSLLLACCHLLLLNNRRVTVEAFSAVAPPPKTASSAFAEDDDDDANKNTAASTTTTTRSSSSNKKPINDDGPFKPWPSPVVVCHGDYREQAYLEDHIGGPLYAQQKNMPRLPIPELQDTIQRFLPTAVPLVENEQEMQSLEQACRDFPQQAQILQERLLQRQQEDFKDSSWLQEMWQKAGYLQVRDPVAVLISYYLLVPHDETLDVQNHHHAGIARGAALLTALAESRKQICSGNMPAESIPRKDGDNDYLCSTGFKYMFHACRIPRSATTGQQDVYHIYDPAVYQHCIVASRGQFYAMDFCNEQGDPLPLTVLEQRLQKCVELSKRQEMFPQLGWLTSCNRDVWAQARNELIDVGKGPMKDALAKIESGAFVLNLDDEEPETLTEDGKIFWYGGDNGGGANRWYDKVIQMLCTKNGHVAYMGEHAMLDAAPAIPLIRRMLKTTHKRLRKKQEKTGETLASEPDEDNDNNNNPGVVNVFEKCWSSKSLLEAANKLTAVAKEHHEKLTVDYELKVLLFSKFGKKYLKQAGFGPEFVQMAMQLAAYRLLGQQVATYEAALARTFLHGRTETARPVSLESNAFVQCMGKEPYDGDRDKKLDLLKKAAAVHEECQCMASKGLGVDRHLFGLSMMVQDDTEKPSLFSHPVFHRSKHWRLSTSAVIFSPGFGPVVDDGLGIGFQVASDSCLFTCTSRKANQYVEPFCDLLEEALTEMGDLLVKVDEE